MGALHTTLYVNVVVFFFLPEMIRLNVCDQTAHWETLYLLNMNNFMSILRCLEQRYYTLVFCVNVKLYCFQISVVSAGFHE